MKKFLGIILLTITLVTAPAIVSQLKAQPPTPPGTGGSSQNQMGGPTAPLEGGLAILITLATSYGVRRASQLSKEKKTEK
jgi:hypothetical protein